MLWRYLEAMLVELLVGLVDFVGNAGDHRVCQELAALL